jgi:hypothetical protein
MSPCTPALPRIHYARFIARADQANANWPAAKVLPVVPPLDSGDWSVLNGTLP